MRDRDEREKEIAGEVPASPTILLVYRSDSPYYQCDRCGYIYALKSGLRKYRGANE